MSGRGRGKKYVPPSGGRMFLMRSADECGLDSRNLRSLNDITRPVLFPPIKLHSSGENRMLLLSEHKSELDGGTVKQENEDVADTTKSTGVKRSAQTLSMISKSREIHHRIQNSVFYVRPTKDVPDVIRYCDSSRPPPPQIDASAVLANCLGGRKRTKIGLFVPEELVSGQKLHISNTGESTSFQMSSNLNDLATEERMRLGSIDQAQEDEEGADDYESTDELEESDGEDYVRDYYESEGDYSDGGGDNEATF